MSRIKPGPFTGSKRAARRLAAEQRRSDRVKGQLNRLAELAKTVRGPEHLRDILAQDQNMTPEMRESVFKMVAPLIPPPVEKSNRIVLVDTVRH